MPELSNEVVLVDLARFSDHLGSYRYTAFRVTMFSQ